MRRSNSLGNCAVSNRLIQTKISGKSMPNIQILAGDEPSRSTEGGGGGGGASGGLKRQGSKKVKILQKTWDKVMTIIHPSGRRNSRTKQSPSGDILAESPNLMSPSFSKVFKSSHSSTPPSTPSKRLVFDFEPITNQVEPIGSDRKPNQKPENVGGKNDADRSRNDADRCRNDADRSRNEPNSADRRPPRDDHQYYQCPEPFDPEVDQVVRNYVELQKRLSDELHQVMKGEKRKEEALSAEFKKRLQQWEMWKASTGKFHYTEEELQKLIPLDFSKKLQEWEHIKSKPRQIPDPVHPGGCGSEVLSSSASSTAPTKNEQRRKKKKNDESHRQKELAWLEKQLEKIEVEKKRLEREMTKYCEREERLQKMREAIRNNPNPKQEVWIKTPTAECKVEGLNEKFTKKLYKWEEKRGIQPECSTMALLNPKYFSTSPEPEQNPTPETEPTLLVQDPEPIEEIQERMSKDYSSQSEEVSEVEYYDEYDATDSFATKDEPASGASNTDSDCFNLKPGFRRRSSDAISTPLSSARSPSPSCCTSDDEENFMLQTVAENEEERIEEKPLPVVVKAKPIVVEDDDIGDNVAGVIVKTQRTIFKPVGDAEDAILSFSASSNLNSPKLVKTLCAQLSRSPEITDSSASRFQGSVQTPGFHGFSEVGISDHKKQFSQKVSEPPPRIIGAVRKNSATGAPPAPTFRLPPIPALEKLPKIKDGSKPILGKIPVWCSPLMARRRFLDSQQNENGLNSVGNGGGSNYFETEKFRPQEQEFSLDKFLEANAIPIPPPRPSRIPVNASPGCSRKKYSFSSGPLRDESNSGVSLLSLTRSNSFQNPGISRVPGIRVPRNELQLPVRNDENEVKGQTNPAQLDPSLAETSLVAVGSVTKSKSTGSILGGGNSRSLFGIASKFVKNSDSKPKKKK